MGRREQVAEAGIRLIARSGTHGLTHRLVDAEAELPRGSTSYYARTRRDLIALVVQRLSEESDADIAELAVPAKLGVDQAVLLIAEVLTRMQGRAEAQAARFALMFEVRADDELRRALTEQAPVRANLESAAAKILRALGVSAVAARANELVALVDALLMYRTVDAAPIDIPAVLRPYLAGLAL